jgi:hypothetical protein
MGGNRMNQVFVLVLSLVVYASADAAQKPADGTKKLTVYAAGQVPGAAELSLLPQPQEMTDADAFPLYQKAVQSLPKGLDWAKIKAWRQTPLKELPQEEIGLLLRRSDAAFRLLEQAGKCRQCEWLLNSGGDSPLDLTACRNSVFLLALQARSQLARGDYGSCTRTLGSGLALAKHLGTAPTVVHLLVGVGVSAVIYDEIEQYLQQPGAPSLEAALRGIPKPLFDEEHSDLYGTDEASRSRAQLVLRRGNRQVVVLQYLETLRIYATKAGRWPQTLEDLKTDLPNDPVAGKPFSYKRLSDTQAILEGPLPKGGGAKDNVRYELNLAKKS